MSSITLGKPTLYFSALRKLRQKILKTSSRFIDPLTLFGSILWASDVSFSKRYRGVQKELLSGTVLDVGSGSKSILSYRGIKVFSIDLTRRKGIDVIASMTNLPFRDNSFTNVISVDALEHIPERLRVSALREMQRTTIHQVIIHTPLEDGRDFRARTYDILFNKWYVEKFGEPNDFNYEHIKNIEPNPKLLISLGFKIIPEGNADLWLAIERLRFCFNVFYPASVIAGWLFYLAHRSSYNRRPFWGAIAIFRNET